MMIIKGNNYATVITATANTTFHPVHVLNADSIRDDLVF